MDFNNTSLGPGGRRAAVPGAGGAAPLAAGHLLLRKNLTRRRSREETLGGGCGASTVPSPWGPQLGEMSPHTLSCLGPVLGTGLGARWRAGFPGASIFGGGWVLGALPFEQPAHPGFPPAMVAEGWDVRSRDGPDATFTARC